jgi:hypothetical protein
MKKTMLGDTQIKKTGALDCKLLKQTNKKTRVRARCCILSFSFATAGACLPIHVVSSLLLSIFPAKQKLKDTTLGVCNPRAAMHLPFRFIRQSHYFQIQSHFQKSILFRCLIDSTQEIRGLISKFDWIILSLFSDQSQLQRIFFLLKCFAFCFCVVPATNHES